MFIIAILGGKIVILGGSKFIVILGGEEKNMHWDSSLGFTGKMRNYLRKCVVNCEI